jgi:hypothetical protein
MPTLFYPSRHPVVVAFFYDHGIEFDLATYEQRAKLLDFEEELISEDPLRISISISVEDDVLGLTYNDRMELIGVNSDRQRH